jgi:hypothetical protein
LEYEVRIRIHNEEKELAEMEKLARDVTLDSGFMFDKSHLDKHFPLLHSTIHQTLIRLAGHRGDKAGHGKDAPSNLDSNLFPDFSAGIVCHCFSPSSGQSGKVLSVEGQGF